MTRRDARGFTLIKVLVGVAIVAVTLGAVLTAPEVVPAIGKRLKDSDWMIRMLAAEGLARKGGLSRFVEDAVRARIIEVEADNGLVGLGETAGDLRAPAFIDGRGAFLINSTAGLGRFIADRGVAFLGAGEIACGGEDHLTPSPRKTLASLPIRQISKRTCQ